MLTWWTCCYHCTNTVQDKALIPKDILPSHWYDQNQGLDSIHYPQKGKPQKNQKSLLQFSRELLHSLIFASKVNPSSSRGRPPKWRSMEAPTTGKKLTEAMPLTDACFDQIVDWPSPNTNKNRCRLCSFLSARAFSVYWLITAVSLRLADHICFHAKR